MHVAVWLQDSPSLLSSFFFFFLSSFFFFLSSSFLPFSSLLLSSPSLGTSWRWIHGEDAATPDPGWLSLFLLQVIGFFLPAISWLILPRIPRRQEVTHVWGPCPTWPTSGREDRGQAEWPGKVFPGLGWDAGGLVYVALLHSQGLLQK